jgi:hypothetical protein
MRSPKLIMGLASPFRVRRITGGKSDQAIAVVSKNNPRVIAIESTAMEALNNGTIRN